MSDYSKMDATQAEYDAAFKEAKAAMDSWCSTCFGCDQDRDDAFLAASALRRKAFKLWRKLYAMI